MEWFRDAKLGIFIHWGIYAIKGIRNAVKDIRVVGREEKPSWNIKMKLSWSDKPGIIYIDIPAGALDPEMTVLALQLDGPVDLYREKPAPAANE